MVLDTIVGILANLPFPWPQRRKLFETAFWCIVTTWLLSWRVSILKDNSMFQTNCIVCIKRQSQSQLIVRSAVITSVMSVLFCREMRGELFLSGAGHDTIRTTLQYAHHTVNHSYDSECTHRLRYRYFFLKNMRSAFACLFV